MPATLLPEDICVLVGTVHVRHNSRSLAAIHRVLSKTEAEEPRSKNWHMAVVVAGSEWPRERKLRVGSRPSVEATKTGEMAEVQDGHM